MSSNVAREESEALQGLLAEGRTVSEVRERDFRELLRLGPARRRELERRLQGVLEPLERELLERVGVPCPIELGGVAETSAQGLFEDQGGPLSALAFSVAGQPAWIQWDNVAAQRAVEKVLGSAPEAEEPRRLSGVECSVLLGLLGTVAAGLLRALGMEGANLRVAQSLESLGTWRDAVDRPDPYRIHVELPIQGPGGDSVLHAYLPAPGDAELAGGAAEARGAPGSSASLPAHLAGVELGLSVTLSTCEVRLDRLLAIEEGDVIPLDARVGDPATLNLEGEPFASCRLGQHLGNVAIRIEGLITDPQDLQ